MEKTTKPTLKSKTKDFIGTAKKYWNAPAKGDFVSYKEIGHLSGAGFGVYWATLLASTIGLNAGNFLVGASIGLKPVDLQIMLNVANLIGIPIGIFRSWYYDNHKLKGGKFLPFLRMTCMPIVLISLDFVWLPYENMSYITCPCCNEKIYPYGKSKIEEVASRYSIPVLGRLPIDEKLSACVDSGKIEEVEGEPLDGAITVITAR